MQPRRFYQQLKSTSGADTVTIDPTTGSLDATFRCDNIEAKMGEEWCYGLKFRVWIRSQVDQPASGGAIIRPDQLYRIIRSVSFKSDDLGQLYSPGDLNGPALGLIAQVVSNGYRLPYMLRSDIAAADGDTAIVFPVDIPLAHLCFHKGHQTGLWNGFLRNNGELKITLNDSTALAAVSTGAALEATTDVRVELIYTSEPEARLPVIWHWRLRNTPPGETRHTIRNIGQGAGITGTRGEGKIAFLAYLSDQNGLGGADGVDNIQRVFPRDRGQQTHNLGSPFYGPASFLTSFIEETRDRNLFNAVQGGAYPLALGTTVDGAPNVATALFLPYFWPSVDPPQQVSKVQEWHGDYNIEQDYAVVPTAQAQWLSLEQSYLTPEQEQFLMVERMQLNASQHVALYKTDRQMHDAGGPKGQAKQAMKLRGIPKKVRSRG